MEIRCNYKRCAVVISLGFMELDGMDADRHPVTAKEAAGALYRFLVDGEKPSDVGLWDVKLLFNCFPHSYKDDAWVDKDGIPLNEHTEIAEIPSSEYIDRMLGMARRDVTKAAEKYGALEGDGAVEAVGAVEAAIV